MKKVILFFIFANLFGVIQGGFTEDFLLPVDHRIDLKEYSYPTTRFYYDDVYIEGASYGKYHILDAYRDKQNDGFLSPIVFSSVDRYTAKDGYIYAFAGYSRIAEPFLVLMGGDVFLYFHKRIYESFHEDYGDVFASRGPGKVYELLSAPVVKGNDSVPGMDKDGVFAYWDDGIASIYAWSTLSEKIGGIELTYSADRMRHPFYDWGDGFINYSNGALFWAEGEAGSGIGGVIDIQLNRLSDHVMVLNGAVDISRRYLYKANNRLKRILVKSSDPAFSFEYTFEDIVEFQEIKLPLSTKKLTFTILEVYNGDKYDDTCITKIFLKQEPLRSRSEYEAQIQKYINLPRIKKSIEDYEKRKENR